MLSTLALGLGFATVALALKGGNEMQTADEMIAATNSETALVYQPGPPPPAFVESERRRITKRQIKDLLDLRICSNNPNAIAETLEDVVKELCRERLSPWALSQCSVLKAVILPRLRHCTLETSGVSHTVYAGFTVDGSLVLSAAGVVGAYLDSDGRSGCFTTSCLGVGVNAGVGGGVVGGVLMGNGNNDFPGVGYGAEFGGDFGPGYDFAGGLTTSALPYVELSAGVGVGFAAGVNRCVTNTHN